MKRMTLIVFGWLVLCFTAQAASFDCGKAGTKLEKLICGDAELSKLDEELNAAYKAALQDQTQAEAIKQAQKQWLKKRNDCSDADCVKAAYQIRISKLTVAPSGVSTPVKATLQAAQQKTVSHDSSNSERYTLLMSKDDELCNHMLKLFNEDLKKYGWNGDKHQEEHEEFKRVHWQPARFSFDYHGHTEYTDVEGALFDFNNDGVQDFVVRWKASLSNARADSLSMLGSEMSKRANDLTSEELWKGENQISLAGNGYSYNQLAHLSEMDADPRGFDPRVFEPFIYRATAYLVMRDLFEDIRDHAGYAVIAKYGGGKFVDRDVSGKMDNICYLKRIGAKRIY